MVYGGLPEQALRLAAIGPAPGLVACVGRAIASIHELPTSIVEAAGLPVYDAETYRQRRLSEADEAARTGKVPASLLRRWENALENVAIWRFRPTVVHGDLTAEHVLTGGSQGTGILAWSGAKVADPAAAPLRPPTAGGNGRAEHAAMKCRHQRCTLATGRHVAAGKVRHHVDARQLRQQGRVVQLQRIAHALRLR